MHSIVEITNTDVSLLNKLIQECELIYTASRMSDIAFNRKYNIVAINNNLNNNLIEIIHLRNFKKNQILDFPNHLNPDKQNLDFGIASMRFSRCNNLLIIRSWVLEMDAGYQIYLYTVPEFELVNFLFDDYDIDNGTYGHNIIRVDDDIIFFDSKNGPGLEKVHFKHFKLTGTLKNEILQ